MRCMAKPPITIDKWMQKLLFQQYYWKPTLCQHLQQQQLSTLGFFSRNLFHAHYWRQLHSYKPSSIVDIDTAGTMTLGCWQKFPYVACSNLSALLQHQAHLCIWFLLHRIVLRQELFFRTDGQQWQYPFHFCYITRRAHFNLPAIHWTSQQLHL